MKNIRNFLSILKEKFRNVFLNFSIKMKKPNQIFLRSLSREPLIVEWRIGGSDP